MAWLDQFLLGIKTLFVGGVQQPTQLGLNLIGAQGVTVTSANNPSLGRADVTISGGIGATGTGFVHVTIGVTDSAARAVNLASVDVTGTLAVANGGTGLASLGTSGYVLTSTGSAMAWAAAATVAITALTGDVTATGPGSTAATVVRVNGATVPAAGSLVTGNAAYVTGASALTYSALNLGGGSGWVTGSLPALNIAPGTDAQMLLTSNSGTLAPVWASMSGAATITHAGVVTVNLGAGATVTGSLPVLNIVAGTVGYVLTSVSAGGGTASWQPASGGGITALTGDVTASGSGSVAATVVKVNGASVPAAGSLTTGNAAYVSGASALTYAALNLGGGSGWVTGALPVANVAAGSIGQVLCTISSGGAATAWASVPAITALTGDATASGTGSVASTVVSAQSGEFLFGATTGLITIAQGATASGVTQTAAAASTTPINYTVTPQAPNGATGSAANNTPGSFVVALAVPGATGTQGNNAALQVTRGGNIIWSIQDQVTLANSPSIYLGQGTPTSSNYTINVGATMGSFLTLKSTQGITLLGGGTITLEPDGAIMCTFNGVSGLTAISGGSIALNSATGSLGGGVGVVYLANAGTAPTTAVSTGGVLYSASQALKWWTGATSAYAPTTLAPASSAGTVNSQTQLRDKANGTCETVSTSTATAILTYTTVSGIGGFLTIRAVSRSTTTGTGIAVGEVSTALYTLAYQNIAGTVSLPAAGPTLVTSQTTVAALTVPTVTATASGNVITILVSNVSLCTVDSTCYLDNYAS